jgi:hypothetical protein
VTDIGAEGAVNEPGPAFFPVGTRKLGFMFFGTLGLYAVHWFYENWWLVKERRHAKLNPMRRAFLSPVFAYSLFRELRSAADEDRIPTAFSPVGATAVYLLGVLVSVVLVDELWPLALLLLYIPVHAANQVAIQVNAVRTPHVAANATLSLGNKLLLAVGSLLFTAGLVEAYAAIRERLGGA